ncbi:hypothetical protein BLNAU_12105 [Blattamonas nauphoetae]|uniref:Protein kinase domain-containing protein n=1 Tax=Blattamonas nauphoetae TaxID=2049346 RepID=A0ABQ9XQ46_9EUKA|nr:hypothetical protein BLNAU_12105 [Blattamonas nauphoetae]
MIVKFVRCIHIIPISCFILLQDIDFESLATIVSSDEDMIALYHSSGLCHSIIRQIRPNHENRSPFLDLAHLSEICPIVSIPSVSDALSSLFRSFLCQPQPYIVSEADAHPDLVDSFLETVNLSSSPSYTPFRHDRYLNLISTLSQSSSPLFTKLSEPLLDPTFPLHSLLYPRSFTDPASSFFRLAERKPTFFRRLIENHTRIILDLAVSTAEMTVRVVSDDPSEPRCLDFGRVTQNWNILLNTLGEVKINLMQNTADFNSIPSSLLTLLVLFAASTKDDLSAAAVSVFSNKFGLSKPHTEALLFATPTAFPLSDAFTPRHSQMLGDSTHSKSTSQSICADAGCCVVLTSHSDNTDQSQKLDLTRMFGVHFAGCLVNALHSTTTLSHSFPFFSPELCGLSRQPSVWNDSSRQSALTSLTTLADIEISLNFRVSPLKRRLSLQDEERLNTVLVHLFPFLGPESQTQFLPSFFTFYKSRTMAAHRSFDRMIECLIEMATADSYHTPIAFLTEARKIGVLLSCINPETHLLEQNCRYQPSFELSIVEKLRTAEGEERWKLLTQLAVVSKDDPDFSEEVMKVENDAQALLILSVHTIRSAPCINFRLVSYPEALDRVIEFAGHLDNLQLVRAALAHIADSVDTCLLPPDTNLFFHIEPKLELRDLVLNTLNVIAGRRREGVEEGCVVGKDEMTSQIVVSCLKVLRLLMGAKSFDPAPVIETLVSLVVTTDLSLLRSLLPVLQQIEERTRNAATPFSISTVTAPFRAIRQTFATQQPLLSIVSSILLSASLDSLDTLVHQENNVSSQVLKELNKNHISEIVKETAEMICHHLEKRRTRSSRTLTLDDSFEVSLDRKDRHATPQQLFFAFHTMIFPGDPADLSASTFLPLAHFFTRILTLVVPSSPDRVRVRTNQAEHSLLLNILLSILLLLLQTETPSSLSTIPLSSLLSVITLALVRIDQIPSSLLLYTSFCDMFAKRKKRSNPKVKQAALAMSEEGMEDRSEIPLNLFSMNFLNTWKGANEPYYFQTNDARPMVLDTFPYFASKEPLRGQINLSGSPQTQIMCANQNDLFIFSVVNATFELTSTTLFPIHQAMHASDSSIHLSGTAIEVNSTDHLIFSWNSEIVLERLNLRRSSEVTILPLLVENQHSSGTVSLISTVLEDGHHSDVSPIVANRQTESVLVQSCSFGNITSNSPIMHPHLATTTGKTRLLNTKTEHVVGVFYGTVTNDINLGGSFLFSNNTFINTTHSNSDSYTCPDEGCTSTCRTDSSDITIDNSVFVNCRNEGPGHVNGGAINCFPHTPGLCTIQNCQFQSCSSIAHAGAIYTQSTATYVHNNLFTGCRAGDYAGAFCSQPFFDELQFYENTCTSCTADDKDSNLHTNNAYKNQIVNNNTFTTFNSCDRSDCLFVILGTGQVSNNLVQNRQTSILAGYTAPILFLMSSVTSTTIYANKFEWESELHHQAFWDRTPDVGVWFTDSFTTSLPLIDSTGFFLPPSAKNDVTTTKDDTSIILISGDPKEDGVFPRMINAPTDSTSPFFSCSVARNVLIRLLAIDMSAAPISFAEVSSGEVVVSDVDFTVSTTALTTDFMKVTSATLKLHIVSLSSLTLESASVVKLEGATTLSVSGSEFKTISQTGSGGGVFLRTNGDSDQIVSITSSSFESMSSAGDGGVILAQLGTGSKLTVADTTFKLCSSSGKGGALSIVLSSTGSFALEAGTSFESCSATGSGSAVFVEASSLASAITETSMAFLAPFPLTPTAALVGMHRGWNTANSSDTVPLVLFFATLGSTGFASASGSDGEFCGFSVYPCSSIDLVQTQLAANGSKTEGNLHPITIELQTALEQSTPFSCEAHQATLTGNTITLSKTGQFTTSSADSVLTLSSLSLYFTSSQTQPIISLSLGKIVVSDCTVGNGDADIPVSFGSVSGGLLEISGTNTLKLVSPSSPLFVVTSGNLKIGSGTTLTHSATTRTSSLFVLSGGSATLTSLSVPSLTLDSASSVFSLTNTASLSVSSITFDSISNEGSGSVIHSTTTGTLSLSSVSFSSCNCGVNGKGRSVFISRPSFSSGDVVMKSVSITTAGTLGSHEVYLEGQNVGAVVTSDWTSLIGMNDETLSKAKLAQVIGSDLTNTTNSGPLGYHLYPHASGAVFVSEGFWDHGKCGQEHLPCSSFTFAYSLLTDTTTEIRLSSDLTLSTTLSSPITGASITSTSQKSLVFGSTGQFVVEAGSLSFSSIGFLIPSSLTKPLFVVKGSTRTLSDTVTITNPSSATHSASLFVVEGGTLTLSSTVFDFTVPFSSTSALLTQTGGNLKLDTVTIGNVSRTIGDGSVVHSTLSSSENKLEIVGCSISACSSTGNGGVLFVSSSLDHNPVNLIINSTFGSAISCGEGKKGEWIFLRGRSFESYLKDSTWTGSISNLVAPADDALLWGEDGSEKEDSEYASLSLLYYLKGYNEPTIAVGDGGRDGVGCGRTHLVCLSLSTAVSHLSGSEPFEIEIVSALSLVGKETFSSSFTMKPSKEAATITVGESGAFEESANILTLSTLTFDGTGTERSTSLLSIVDTGSITIAGCTFTNLKTSGKGSVFSSTLTEDNTLSVSNSSFSSCSSTENGGALFVEVNGGSFVIPKTLTFTRCSSQGKGQNLFIIDSNLQLLLSGGSLDGIKPTLPSTGLVSKEEKEKWFGSTSTPGESNSLLFFWYPHIESSGAVHVHENGESHSLCGLPQLPCSLIQSSLSKANSDNKTVIDSDFVLNEEITTANTPSTLTSVSKNVTVSVGEEGGFALSSGSLTLSALSFVQSSSVELLEHALISVGSASSSLIVDDCSFSSFRLSLNALIEHSCSSLTLKSSTFTDIVRSEGDGGVVESVMDEGMELDVDSVELASVWTLAGDGDGFFISFNSISDPTNIPSFNLKNLKYSEKAGSEKNTDRKACFVWIEGKRLSEWVGVSDARFAGSYTPIRMESEWLWSVDWEEGLNASLLFYLVAHTGAIGVSSEGYSIVQCGYSGVWCRGLEYGMAVADSKGEKQLNIHNTVEITHLIDLNEEYRVHGKVGSSMLSIVGSGGLVVDSGEHVEMDGVSVIVGVDCSSEVFSCVSSELVLHSIVFSCGGDSSSLINTTLICVDGEGSLGQLSSLSLLSGVSSDGKLLLVKKGTVQMTDLWVSPSISSSDGLVSVVGGSFSLVNLALPPLSFSSTPFILSSFDACSFTNLTAKQIQTQTLLTAERGEDLTLTSCTFDGITTTRNDGKEDENDELCAWETGLIKITETPTTIYSSFFSHLPQGALHVNGSVVSLYNTVFIANSAKDPTYTSVSRNMRCLSGAVEIENEQRENEESESLWISTDDCVVKKGSELIAPSLFVPKLDVGKTKSVSNKNKSVSIDLVGSMLIPCNLFLLISEVGSSSSSEGLRIELTPSKFGWKDESSISVSLSSSELEKLNRTFGWNGTLVFGDGSTTDWFVVKASQSDERKALMKQAMKWMIPLIGGCVVALLLIIILIVLLRRRSSKAKEKESLLKQEQAEMNDLPPEKFEELDKIVFPQSSIVAAEGSIGDLAQADGTDHELQQMKPSFPLGTDSILPASGEQSTSVLSKQSGSVGVNERDTLYNRLHSAQKRPIDKMGVAQQIMRKLVGLHRQDPTLSVLTMFSSHSVVFREDGEVEIALDVGETMGHTRSQAQRTQTCQEGQRNENTTHAEGEMKNEQFELLRWRAPETVVSEGEKGQKVDSGSAAVFSLGLVLFEIETGQVPFGEMDALNASRQLKTGIPPKLSLVGDVGLRDVIVSCLQVRGKDRPRLGEMEEKLKSVEFSSGSAVFFDAAQ